MQVLLKIISGLITNWFLTKIIVKPFKKLIPDVPNKRSLHHSIKPRGGGITFIFSNLIITNIIGGNNFLFLIPLCFICLLDDFFNLNRWLRLITQLTTSLVIVFNANLIDLIFTINNDFLIIFLAFTVTIFLTAIINFCNFMDGIDGILTLTIIVILISASLISTASVWVLIGSLIGFLFWNWSPSKIFMGDIGSNFLGGVLIWAILNTNSINNSLALFLISLPLLFDPLICLLIRFFYKENIFNAHSKHLYQRLVQGGMSHQMVTIIYATSSAFISFSFFVGGIKTEIFSCLFVLIFGIYLNKNFAINFKRDI